MLIKFIKSYLHNRKEKATKLSKLDYQILKDFEVISTLEEIIVNENLLDSIRSKAYNLLYMYKRGNLKTKEYKELVAHRANHVD